MRHSKFLIILAFLFPSQGLAAPGHTKGACRTEVRELCGDHRGDRSAMKACIEAKKGDFSERCQRRLARRDWSKRRGNKSECRAEIKKNCGEHRGDPAGMKACLEVNKDRFSKRCHERLARRDWSKRGGRKGICRTEIKEFCGAMRGKRSEMRRCVQSNLERFSEACQRRIKRRITRREQSASNGQNR